MEKFITALAPVFAAGFAVQQFLEIPGTLIDIFDGSKLQKFKKTILGIIGTVIGLVLAGYFDDLRVLKILVPKMSGIGIQGALDVIVTGLILSAGTEGVNSILKFLKYAKEEKKNEAAAGPPEKPAQGVPAPLAAGSPVPMPEALENMNLK